MTTRRPNLPINRNFVANCVPEVNGRWRGNSPGLGSGYWRNMCTRVEDLGEEQVTVVIAVIHRIIFISNTKGN
jgi:hypothetical protein